MAVRGYVRASTAKQKDSPEVQKEQVRRYCYAARISDGVALLEPGQEPEWYIDPATSGKIHLKSRDAGAMLVSHLKRGDHVVVAKLDRAFRKASDCLNFIEWCERAGVNLHVTDLHGMAIDVTKHIGKFIITIIAGVAELERSYTSERTKDGIRHRRRQKLAHGCARYGTKYETRYKTEDGKRIPYRIEVPDPEERHAMKLILSWRTEDPPWSWRQIFEKLNYTLKLTHKGRTWCYTSIAQAARAEAILQFREATDGRIHEESR